jgi:hypothetical protein
MHDGLSTTKAYCIVTKDALTAGHRHGRGYLLYYKHPGETNVRDNEGSRRFENKPFSNSNIPEQPGSAMSQTLQCLVSYREHS